ncbi:carotenoid biosynthesis protein [Caldisericum exile]|uniref:Hypothetical membrane protein n=1 Tax=Caldisericum exile (strain DSM 21853 / NBRC 104410 / AZM16c01) TaxID=511051 RepID=A0A7U6GDJ2_CALEA|nr:carotenoid biosynthesis protein [Caldisericum exile]BAL80432.1 hypothetical membrane protein [Caldisericum exile AZM16c01]
MKSKTSEDRFATLIKFLILFLLPLVYENIGMNFGGPLGVRYHYAEFFRPKVFGLPMLVWIFWVIFIFTGYGLTNCIIKNILREKYLQFISKKLNILFAVVLDGFIVTTFDLFIDPVAVRFGLWSWENVNNGYFGVPFGNFIGWFVIVSTTTLLLRFVDKFYSSKLDNRLINLSPYVYILLLSVFFISSVVFYSIELALSSLLFSSVIVAFSLYLFSKSNFDKL